jgi:hypothetical protein
MLTVLQNWKLSAFVCLTEISDFNLFHADFKHQNCPSARCALAAHSVSGDSDIWHGQSVLINNLLDVDIFIK